MKIKKKNFIYLISPNKIVKKSFFKTLETIFQTRKIKFFQLRQKKEALNKKILNAKKILKICRKYGVKFLINDDPHLALKVQADGCHLGQKDMNVAQAKKILSKKIIGVTCHNSLKLAKKAKLDGASYIALGAFFKSSTKKVKYKASVSTLKKIKKIINIPIVAIGGINQNNYKKLLLNNADFLAISGYIWKNKKLKPQQAIENLK